MRQATMPLQAARPERPHCSRGEGQDQRENEQRKHRFRLKSRLRETCLASHKTGSLAEHTPHCKYYGPSGEVGGANWN